MFGVELLLWGRLLALTLLFWCCGQQVGVIIVRGEVLYVYFSLLLDTLLIFGTSVAYLVSLSSWFVSTHRCSRPSKLILSYVEVVKLIGYASCSTITHNLALYVESFESYDIWY